MFQLESRGHDALPDAAASPTRVDDLYAMVALYRPGPLEQIPVYIHNKNHPREIKLSAPDPEADRWKTPTA